MQVRRWRSRRARPLPLHDPGRDHPHRDSDRGDRRGDRGAAPGGELLRDALDRPARQRGCAGDRRGRDHRRIGYFGELVPKRIALLNPEGVASVLARPMQLLSGSRFPLVRALTLSPTSCSGCSVLRRSPERSVSEEEINVLMEQGAEAGVFEKHEQALVSRVFRMDDQRIWSAMTPRVDIVYLDLERSVRIEPQEAPRQRPFALRGLQGRARRDRRHRARRSPSWTTPIKENRPT